MINILMRLYTFRLIRTILTALVLIIVDRRKKKRWTISSIQAVRELVDVKGTEIDDKLGNIQTHLFEKRDYSAMECLNKLIEEHI